MLPKGLEPADLDRLLASPDVRRESGLRWRLMMELMAKAGMRVSEVCNLRLRNLRTSDWRIEIRDGKTGDRFIYLPRELEPLMEQWLARRAEAHPDSEWLFPSRTGGHLSRTQVGTMMATRAKRLGIEGVHPHALRHTFATEFIRNGGDPATLQAILGHSTATMSLRYAMANPARVREVMRGAR